MTLRSIRNSLGENRRMFFATRRELGNAWTREKTGGWGERETGERGSGKVRRQSRDAARKHAYLVDSPADKSDEPSLRRSITSGRRAFSPFSAWMLMFYFDSGN